jgi:hypothetical protein
MKVLTKYPVYINRKKVSGADLYMNFDSNGKPTKKEEWKVFQNWYNSKGFSPKLTADGIAGNMTNAAWASQGSTFVAEAKALTNVVTNATSGAPIVTTSEPTQQQKDEAAKRGLQWDKLKGWVAVATQAGQQSGLFDALLNKVGLGTTSTTPVTTTSEGGGTAVLPGGGSVTVTTPEEEAKKKRRKMLIIGGVAVVVIVAAVLLLRKKGDSATSTPAPAK